MRVPFIKRLLFSAIPGSLLFFSLAAAEPEGDFPPPREGRNYPRHGGGPRGNGFFGRSEAEMAVAEKFPAETAELDKQLLEIEKKYEELAKKANVNWPASMENNIRKLRVADPEGFRTVMEEIKKDRRSGMRKMAELAKKNGIEMMSAGAGRNPNRSPNAPEMGGPQRPPRGKLPNLSQLRRKYPAEMKEYERLKHDDPEKAKALLMDLMNR